jgi:hypothetical protein
MRLIRIRGMRRFERMSRSGTADEITLDEVGELLFEDGQRRLTGPGRRVPYLATGDLRSSGNSITRYAV